MTVPEQLAPPPPGPHRCDCGAPGPYGYRVGNYWEWCCFKHRARHYADATDAATLAIARQLTPPT
jgi:hypothetical protein